jgi:large subunit ribosomal protein L2
MLKKYKPVTPSLRHRLILNSLKFSLTDRGPGFNKRNLIKGFKKTSGRNNQGRITSFRKGGGHKRL